MFNSLVSTFHRFCPLLFVDLFGIVVLNNVETSEIMFSFSRCGCMFAEHGRQTAENGKCFSGRWNFILAGTVYRSCHRQRR